MSANSDAGRTRYLVVLTAIVALTVVGMWYVTNSPVGHHWLFAILAGALVVAGVEWDRIVLHGMRF